MVSRCFLMCWWYPCVNHGGIQQCLDSDSNSAVEKYETWFVAPGAFRGHSSWVTSSNIWPQEVFQKPKFKSHLVWIHPRRQQIRRSKSWKWNSILFWAPLFQAWSCDCWWWSCDCCDLPPGLTEAAVASCEEVLNLVDYGTQMRHELANRRVTLAMLVLVNWLKKPPRSWVMGFYATQRGEVWKGCSLRLNQFIETYRMIFLKSYIDLVSLDRQKKHTSSSSRHVSATAMLLICI